MSFATLCSRSGYRMTLLQSFALRASVGATLGNCYQMADWHSRTLS
jgi:hypothetical protein